MKLGEIFSYFTLIALIVGALGLFGLASFIAARKTKEIGIRKALGATIADIIYLLAKQFLKWVFLASIIAVPISYYAMNGWLTRNFIYRVDIGVLPFVLALLIALMITAASVGYQSVKVSLTNPAVTVKYE